MSILISFNCDYNQFCQRTTKKIHEFSHMNRPNTHNPMKTTIKQFYVNQTDLYSLQKCKYALPGFYT